MMVSEQIILSHATADAAGGMDPLRTVAGLVGGIGFLGAGAIVQGRGSVRGLTTAASIWMTAALGIAAGVEAYQTLTLAFLVVLVVLIPLRFLEKKMRAHRHGPGESEFPDEGPL
jgi:putative Mg2+ transporter-C (MgtC) family protein